MKWTELYYETKMLFGIIFCGFVLVVVFFTLIIHFCNKVIDRFNARLEKKTVEKLENKEDHHDKRTT